MPLDTPPKPPLPRLRDTTPTGRPHRPSTGPRSAAVLVRRVRVPQSRQGSPIRGCRGGCSAGCHLVVDLILASRLGRSKAFAMRMWMRWSPMAGRNVAVLFGYGGLGDAPRVPKRPSEETRALVRLPYLVGQCRGSFGSPRLNS